jgi:hypothetical protein
MASDKGVVNMSMFLFVSKAGEFIEIENCKVGE